jgi:pimeloyl-ACP methyl ester carboxylesterase
MSLVKPPGRQRGSLFAAIGRLLVTIVVLAFIGAFAWAIFTSNSIEREENVNPNLSLPGRIVTLPSFGDVHLREIGSGGTPVLFIHDFDIAGGYQWLPVAESLGSRWMLIPDMIDFGFSARPSDPGRIHTVVGRAEALFGLLDELEIDRVSVVGAGYGGEVAAEMAALEPDLVVNLGLISPEIYGPEQTWESYLFSLPVLADAMNFTFIGAGSRAENRYAAGCERGGWCPSPDALAVRDQTARIPGTAEALTGFAQSPEASTLPDALSAITAPTLILWGEDDLLTPFEQGQQLSAAIEGSQLTVVPGTGHRPHLEDAAAVAGFIGDFLDS